MWTDVNDGGYLGGSGLCVCEVRGHETAKKKKKKKKKKKVEEVTTGERERERERAIERV